MSHCYKERHLVIKTRTVLRGDGDIGVGGGEVVDVVKGIPGHPRSVVGANGISNKGEVAVLPCNQDVSRAAVVVEGMVSSTLVVLVLAGGVDLDAERLSEGESGVVRALSAVVLRRA